MASSADLVVLAMIAVSYLVLTHLYWAIARFWYNDTDDRYTKTLLTFFAILCLEGMSIKELRSVQMWKAEYG